LEVEEEGPDGTVVNGDEKGNDFDKKPESIKEEEQIKENNE
jgi:hypothetical protein